MRHWGRIQSFAMELKIISLSSKKQLAVVEVLSDDTVADVKEKLHDVHPKLYPARVSLRLDPKVRNLKDEYLISSLEIQDRTIYAKDLGPQVSWRTVFLVEYSGPLFLYLFFYVRPWILYGDDRAKSRHHQVDVLMWCHSFHYGKRLLETVFIHRFSKGTMPIMNIFRNSMYYWGFGMWMAYFINHPLYTPTCENLFYGALVGFMISELGNLSIHVALRNLRPPGTRVRAIPQPNANPFTWLFSLVSCPNYTYEIMSWFFFTLMSWTLTSAFFMLLGGYTMTVWALGKHKNYRREFPDYPRTRKAIFPLLI